MFVQYQTDTHVVEIAYLCDKKITWLHAKTFDLSVEGHQGRVVLLIGWLVHHHTTFFSFKHTQVSTRRPIFTSKFNVATTNNKPAIKRVVSHYLLLCCGILGWAIVGHRAGRKTFHFLELLAFADDSKTSKILNHPKDKTQNTNEILIMCTVQIDDLIGQKS